MFAHIEQMFNSVSLVSGLLMWLWLIWCSGWLQHSWMTGLDSLKSYSSNKPVGFRSGRNLRETSFLLFFPSSLSKSGFILKPKLNKDISLLIYCSSVFVYVKVLCLVWKKQDVLKGRKSCESTGIPLGSPQASVPASQPASAPPPANTPSHVPRQTLLLWETSAFGSLT